ncbi:protein kinase C beta type-like [Galendromus occidentalis]|uniref:Protein kinase C beta type-like n=1 Tax=Galendromus occidentalis TaxID=34638 RepID=A0AAJ6VX51_9ACAR|nr:protein kinase C beta type-like [Galendromus occidentalis]
MDEERDQAPGSAQYTRAIKQSMRQAIIIAYDNYPDVVHSAQVCLESFIKTERVLTTNRYPREHYVQEQHCLVAIDYADRIAKKRFNFLDAREDLGNLAVLYEEFVSRDPRAAVTSLRLFRALVQIISELASLIENQTRVQITNWQSVLEFYAIPVTSSVKTEDIANLLPRVSQITEIKVLGAGGFGAIYHVRVGNINLSGKLVPTAKFKTTKQACAEKVVGSMVNSPLLVRYHACYQTSHAYVTLMEYIRGVDLQRIIQGRTNFLNDDVNKIILAQLGLALQYLHYRGFIHRDIKPSNVMIHPTCRVQLIDFDTCKICVGRFLSGNQNSFIRRTFVEFNDGESAGTLYFLPPEILRRKPYGRAMDWWALGVTSYQLCSGKLPFRGYNEKILKERIKKGHVKYVSGATLHQELTKKLLVKFPTQRITSARFEDYKNHAWFGSVDWHRMGCIDPAPLSCFFNAHDGTFSPKADMVAHKVKAKKLLNFSQVYDLPAHEQEPLFTLLSRGFEYSMRKLHSGEMASESDMTEPFESADTNVKFSKYKFNSYLIGKNKSKIKQESISDTLNNDAFEQEVITEQQCSLDEESVKEAEQAAPIAASTDEDDLPQATLHQAAQLANTKAD